MELFATSLGFIVAAGWVPVLARFWKSWRARHHPLSLAICALISLMVYINLAVYFFVTSNPMWTSIIIGSLNIAIICAFYICLYWEKKIFPNDDYCYWARQTKGECMRNSFPDTFPDSPPDK